MAIYASKLSKRVKMAVVQSGSRSIGAAFLAPQNSRDLRCRWILRRRKRFCRALPQWKPPRPQYRPPFHPSNAHAHGSAACRARGRCDAWNTCKQCFARSLHVRNRAVSVIARPQNHAGGFDRPAGGSFSCRGQSREKAEANRKRRGRWRKEAAH